MNTAERRLPLAILGLIAGAIAIAAIVAAASFVGRSGQAVHDDNPCTDVPAGFECVELTNKGNPSQTLGELFFQLNGSTLTMLTNLFTVPDFGHDQQKLCVDDDSDPLANKDSCLGNSAETKITDCGNLPDAAAGETDGSKYEVFIEGSGSGEPLEETTDVVDSLTLARYDVCVDDYTHFSFHFNQGDFSIEGFFQPTPPLLTPTVATEIHAGTDHATDIQNTTVDVGTVVHDQATVSGTGDTPTGTVDFARFSTNDCTGSSVDENDVALSSGVAESSDFTTVAGSLSYKVHYDGDTNYDPADGTCEPLTVQAPTTTTTTTTTTDVLAETEEPEALPASGGAPAEGSGANLPLLAALGGLLLLLSGAGTLVAVAVRRQR